MTGLEILVIAVGLIVGWMVVSRFMVARPPSLPTSVKADGDPGSDAPWHDVLGVPAGAGFEQIQRAHREKMAELDRSAPAIMTESERAIRDQLRARLEEAYRTATQQSSRPDIGDK